MSKQDSIIDFSIIVNKGYSNNKECEYFKTVNHPKLVEQFIEYINKHKDLISLTKIENRQSIADSGCDIFVELKGTVKIGVQIKSNNDVIDENFSNKVKAQFAESHALGLDKYYILICAEMSNSNERKVNYILSNMATYKTNYHVVIGPNNCLKIFHPSEIMVQEVFTNQKRLYSQVENQNELNIIFQALKDELNKTSITSTKPQLKFAIQRNSYQALTTCDKFSDFIGSNSIPEKQVNLRNLNLYFSTISKLPKDVKDLYTILLNESEKDDHYINGIITNLNEVIGHTNFSKSQLRDYLEILMQKKYKLVQHDEDEPNSILVNFWGDEDINVAAEVKLFCESNNYDLHELFTSMNFDKFE